MWGPSPAAEDPRRLQKVKELYSPDLLARLHNRGQELEVTSSCRIPALHWQYITSFESPSCGQFRVQTCVLAGVGVGATQASERKESLRGQGEMESPDCPWGGCWLPAQATPPLCPGCSQGCGRRFAGPPSTAPQGGKRHSLGSLGTFGWT